MKVLKQIFCMSVISVLGQVHGAVVLAPQCPIGSGYEISILGWMLQGHIYKTKEANFPLGCLLACREDDRCQSFNWVISRHLCEFNNRTKADLRISFQSQTDFTLDDTKTEVKRCFRQYYLRNGEDLIETFENNQRSVQVLWLL